MLHESSLSLSVCVYVQQLGKNLGHNVSQATDSLSASNIAELIDNNIPQVYIY